LFLLGELELELLNAMLHLAFEGAVCGVLVLVLAEAIFLC
jgi:hypothetical protein